MWIDDGRAPPTPGHEKHQQHQQDTHSARPPHHATQGRDERDSTAGAGGREKHQTRSCSSHAMTAWTCSIFFAHQDMPLVLVDRPCSLLPDLVPLSPLLNSFWCQPASYLLHPAVSLVTCMRATSLLFFPQETFPIDTSATPLSSSPQATTSLPWLLASISCFSRAPPPQPRCVWSPCAHRSLSLPANITSTREA